MIEGDLVEAIKVISRQEIESIVNLELLLENQAEAFMDVSEKRIQMTPVGHLDFKEEQGECHIKSGFIEGDSYFCVKIATSFFMNPKAGLPTGNGLMSVWSKKTGALLALICDEGYLTDLRTALAGILATRFVFCSIPSSLGIFGTGMQAYLQLKLHKHFFPIKTATIWGRTDESLQQFRKKAAHLGVDLTLTKTPQDVLAHHDLILTTTASKMPLFDARWIRPGTHLTALGADGGGKQELDPMLFKRAQSIYVDSREQCASFGDSSYAIQRGFINLDQLIPLGEAIKTPMTRCTEDITIADLTGIASQDIRIATWFYERLSC
jgi:ornithine cyclodeaminase